MPEETVTQNTAASPAEDLSSRSRWIWLWWLPVFAVIGGMLFISDKVLVPATKDPDSSLYQSPIGYPSKQRKASKPIDVEVVEISTESVTDFVAAAGETVALVDLDVCCLLNGTVDKVLVEEGDYVIAGQTLAKLDTGPWEDALSRQQAELEISRLNIDYYPALHQIEEAELKAKVKRTKKHLEIVQSRLDRYNMLRKRSAASAEEIATVEELVATRVWELASAEKELKQHLLDAAKEIAESKHKMTVNEALVSEAERNLRYATIKAPSDGLVTQLNIQPGELIHEIGDVAMQLSNDVVFKAYIDQTRVDAVQVGDGATVRIVAEPGKLFQGTVIRVNPSVDAHGQDGGKGRVDTRFTYAAWIKMDEGDMPVGLQGNAEFRKELSLTMIPESAVIHLSGGEGMVMLVRDNRTVMKRVELGRQRGELREVKSGLYSGDQVVLKPMGLEADDLVNPSAAASAPQQVGSDEETEVAEQQG